MAFPQQLLIWDFLSQCYIHDELARLKRENDRLEERGSILKKSGSVLRKNTQVKYAMPKSIIVHSDRGSQYCSAAYQKLFTEHQLIGSMSKKVDCYNNAAMESQNHSFKVEAIHGERFLTRSDAKYQVFDYIEVYYNRKRLHSKLSYVSPETFEAKKVA